jgi:nucleoside-diphosphate-sugar epimerase
MRVVVTGATGNVGVRVTEALAADQAVDEITGLATRPPDTSPDPKVTYRRADVTRDDLVPLLRGADAVVHLAWRMQPSHQPDTLWEINVVGSRRVFAAAAEAGVGAIVHASSIGAYSPGPPDKFQLVDESWPTDGIATSAYSREKAYLERTLDAFELAHPSIRVVRLRPALIFQREAASEIRRYFAGPLLPGSVFRRDIPVLPRLPRLALQALHAEDVADAYRRAVVGDARGAFNVAAEPVLDAEALAKILGGRTIPAPPVGLVRGLAAASWALRVQPTAPGWLDLALQIPLMDASRARKELGWRPSHDAESTLRELLGGLRDGAGGSTPPLKANAGGPLRSGEVPPGQRG